MLAIIQGTMSKKPIPPAVREYLSKMGSKGGKSGKREDKVKAGKLGHAAQIESLAKKLAEGPAPAPETAPEPEPAAPPPQTVEQPH